MKFYCSIFLFCINFSCLTINHLRFGVDKLFNISNLLIFSYLYYDFGWICRFVKEYSSQMKSKQVWFFTLFSRMWWNYLNIYKKKMYYCVIKGHWLQKKVSKSNLWLLSHGKPFFFLGATTYCSLNTHTSLTGIYATNIMQLIDNSIVWSSLNKNIMKSWVLLSIYYIFQQNKIVNISHIIRNKNVT